MYIPGLGKLNLKIDLEEETKGKKLPYVFRFKMSEYKYFFAITIPFVLLNTIIDLFILNVPYYAYLTRHFLEYITVIFLGTFLISYSKHLMKHFNELLGVTKGPKSYFSISLIFYNYDEYRKFAKDSFLTVFFPADGDKLALFGVVLYWILHSATIYSYYTKYHSIIYALFQQEGYLILPYTAIARISYWVYWSFMDVILFSLFYIILRMAFVMNQLKHLKKSFTIYRTIEWLNTLKVKRGTETKSNLEVLLDELYKRKHYTIFNFVASSFSSFFMKISLIALGVGLAYSIYGVYTWQYMNRALYEPARFYLDIIVSTLAIGFGIFIFLHPQLQLHNLMAAYKNNVLYLLKDVYETGILSYITLTSIEEKQKIWTDLEVIKKAIEYIKKLDVWPITTDQLIKIGGAVFLTLESFIVQLLLVLFS